MKSGIQCVLFLRARSGTTTSSETDDKLRESEMTRWIFPIALLALALPPGAAKAQLYDPRYPVCLHVYGELEGERMDCIFTSLAPCSTSASRRPGTCLINPSITERRGRSRR